MVGTRGPTPNRPAINPFLLPMSGDQPVRPLCPWREQVHESYYVAVNHTEEAFDEFRQSMGDLGDLNSDGRLVLVTGESGCGKTSLINRCAAWIGRVGQQRYFRTVIVDLTREGASGPQRSVAERMKVVCRRLLDELIHEKVLESGQVGDLAARCDQPDLFYPFLCNSLPDDVVQVVLLPSTDELTDEIVRYAALARKKLVFFAESAYLTSDQVRQATGSWLARSPTVLLEVGPLRSGDVRRFVTDRLTRHTEHGEYPTMDERTMEMAAVPLRSIAMVQRILHGVYEYRRQQGLRYSADDHVTYEDITRFFYEQQTGVGR